MYLSILPAEEIVAIMKAQPYLSRLFFLSSCTSTGPQPRKQVCDGAVNEIHGQGYLRILTNDNVPQ